MKLTGKKRSGETKGVIKKLRRDGKIPAVLYSNGKTSESIEVDAAEFQAALRTIKKGHLSTSRFSLEIDGKSRNAIVKDIQYDLTSYRVIHLDFEELEEQTQIRVKVPVAFTGVAECVGTKLGGVLRQVIRQVQVECLPKDMPTQFTLDVRELKMKQVKRLSDIAMPKGVKPLATTDEVVVVIAKR